MNCEYCGKVLRKGDMVHGIKYGGMTTTGFKPAQDSAVTVLCGPCGNQIYRLVYSSLDRGKLDHPAIFKLHSELVALMKNGWKLIRAISKLPVQDQTAIQRLIDICKTAN